MAAHAPTTGAQLCAPFNPPDWLAQFETVGGAYILTDRLSLEEVLARARLISRPTGHDRKALVAHLRAVRDSVEA